MRIWSKLAFAAAAPLLLTGCLWSPGKFQSELTLRKNGTFVMDYRGEILLQMPNDSGAPAPWNESMIRCYKDGRVESGTVPVVISGDDEKNEDATTATADTRPCTPSEISAEKTKYEKQESDRLAKKSQENSEMAKLFGLPGTDDVSNRAFAIKLMKQAGWKSVAYKGKGLFDVVYRFEGSARQDYAFPLMPDSDMLIPFVTIRPRADGSVQVTAPAFTGGSGPLSARARIMGLPDKGGDGPKSIAQGRFTIVTDGEILTNNSEDGPTPHAGGRQVHWDVTPASDKLPEALIRLR
jgi:hypothetical protein